MHSSTARHPQRRGCVTLCLRNLWRRRRKKIVVQCQESRPLAQRGPRSCSSFLVKSHSLPVSQFVHTAVLASQRISSSPFWGHTNHPSPSPSTVTPRPVPLTPTPQFRFVLLPLYLFLLTDPASNRAVLCHCAVVWCSVDTDIRKQAFC